MGGSARTTPTDLARAGRETRASVASSTGRAAGDPIRGGCCPNRVLERDDPSNRSHRISRDCGLRASVHILLAPSSATRSLPDSVRRICRQDANRTSWSVHHSKGRRERSFTNRTDGLPRTWVAIQLCSSLRRRRPSDSDSVYWIFPVVRCAWQPIRLSVVSKGGYGRAGQFLYG